MSLALDMFAVPGVTRLILGFLDLSAIETIVRVFESTSRPLGFLNDRLLWTDLSRLHFSGQRGVQFADLSTMEQQGNAGTSRTPKCDELTDFLKTKDERMYFDKAVKVFFKGGLDEELVAANSPLRKDQVGPTQVSEQSLNDHMNGHVLIQRELMWSAVATPTLKLYMTYKKARNATGQEDFVYENAMNAISRVTIASFSTGGRMETPCEKGAQVVLRTIQMCLRANRLDAKLACVCYDEAVLKAFTEQKQAVLDRFNEKAVLPAIF